MAFGDDGNLYAMTVKDAPLGRIIAIPLASAGARERDASSCRETDVAAESVVADAHRASTCTYRVGGPSRRAHVRARRQARWASCRREPVSDIAHRRRASPATTCWCAR